MKVHNNMNDFLLDFIVSTRDQMNSKVMTVGEFIAEFLSNNSIQNILLDLPYKKNKEKIENPLWEIIDGKLIETKYIHNFEAYIPNEFKFGWNDLSNETKTAYL